MFLFSRRRATSWDTWHQRLIRQNQLVIPSDTFLVRFLLYRWLSFMTNFSSLAYFSKFTFCHLKQAGRVLQTFSKSNTRSRSSRRTWAYYISRIIFRHAQFECHSLIIVFLYLSTVTLCIKVRVIETSISIIVYYVLHKTTAMPRSNAISFFFFFSQYAKHINVGHLIP